MRLDDAAGIGSNRRWPDGTPVYTQEHPLRLTAAEWRSWTRSRRTWRRRVVASVLTVVVLEAAVAAAYQRMFAALESPSPPAPA